MQRKVEQREKNVLKKSDYNKEKEVSKMFLQEVTVYRTRRAARFITLASKTLLGDILGWTLGDILGLFLLLTSNKSITN